MEAKLHVGNGGSHSEACRCFFSSSFFSSYFFFRFLTVRESCQALDNGSDDPGAERGARFSGFGSSEVLLPAVRQDIGEWRPQVELGSWGHAAMGPPSEAFPQYHLPRLASSKASRA